VARTSRSPIYVIWQGIPATAASIVRKTGGCGSSPTIRLHHCWPALKSHLPETRYGDRFQCCGNCSGSAQFAASAGQEDPPSVRRPGGCRPGARVAAGHSGNRRNPGPVLDFARYGVRRRWPWSPPNGYPDVALAWQSAAGTLARWNAHLSIAGRWWPNTLTGPALSTMVPKKTACHTRRNDRHPLETTLAAGTSEGAEDGDLCVP